MINKIIEENSKFLNHIKNLKNKSKRFPEICIEQEDNKVSISSLVRIKRNDKYYLIHCVETGFLNKSTSRENMLLKFVDSCYKIILFYQITEIYEELDTLQISEKERLFI